MWVGILILGAVFGLGAAWTLGLEASPSNQDQAVHPWCRSGEETSFPDAEVPSGLHPRDEPASEARPVRWVRPLDSDARQELDRWCRAVGPPVVHRPRSAPPPTAPRRGAGPAGRLDTPAEPGSPEGLVVAAWNTHVGGGNLDRFLQDLRSGRLTGAPVADFVVLLQEAYRTGDAVPEGAEGQVRSADRIGRDHEDRRSGSIDEVARRHALHLFYAPSMRNGHLEKGNSRPSEDRGNAILSTLPLSALQILELPVQKQRRVVVVATVEWTGSDGASQNLRVASVHLDHVSGWRRLHRSLGADRADHVRLLVDAFEDEERIVVGGDFNSWFGGRSEEGIRTMRSHFPQPANPPIRATLAHRIPLLSSLVDHLFFRVPEEWTALYQVVADRYGSDHRPLVGWVGATEPGWGRGLGKEP
jgi:endonuclease/exonuclease/phosphatase family metal-dependent hydrolase